MHPRALVQVMAFVAALGLHADLGRDAVLLPLALVLWATTFVLVRQGASRWKMPVDLALVALVLACFVEVLDGGRVMTAAVWGFCFIPPYLALRQRGGADLWTDPSANFRFEESVLSEQCPLSEGGKRAIENLLSAEGFEESTWEEWPVWRKGRGIIPPPQVVEVAEGDTFLTISTWAGVDVGWQLLRRDVTLNGPFGAAIRGRLEQRLNRLVHNASGGE